MKENARPEFDFKVRLQMPAELVKWLVGLVVGGTAATAVAHLLH
jgi:hypothetical protein